MIAYHNSQAYKDQFVALLEWHRDQDKIVAGQYWRNDQGCAVGCALESIRIIEKLPAINHNDHSLSEQFIGVPCLIFRLNDDIFEGLPHDMQQQWPIRFAHAIRPGADLSLVWSKFVVWMLVDPADGVIRFDKNDKQRDSIAQRVADLYSRQIEGAAISISEWRGAYADAYADADAYAAAAADDADADAASKQQSRIKQANKLIELLQVA